MAMVRSALFEGANSRHACFTLELIILRVKECRHFYSEDLKVSLTCVNNNLGYANFGAQGIDQQRDALGRVAPHPGNPAEPDLDPDAPGPRTRAAQPTSTLPRSSSSRSARPRIRRTPRRSSSVVLRCGWRGLLGRPNPGGPRPGAWRKRRNGLLGGGYVRASIANAPAAPEGGASRGPCRKSPRVRAGGCPADAPPTVGAPGSPRPLELRTRLRPTSAMVPHLTTSLASPGPPGPDGRVSAWSARRRQPAERRGGPAARGRPCTWPAARRVGSRTGHAVNPLHRGRIAPSLARAT